MNFEPCGCHKLHSELLCICPFGLIIILFSVGNLIETDGSLEIDWENFSVVRVTQGIRIA